MVSRRRSVFVFSALWGMLFVMAGCVEGDDEAGAGGSTSTSTSTASGFAGGSGSGGATGGTGGTATGGSSGGTKGGSTGGKAAGGTPGGAVSGTGGFISASGGATGPSTGDAPEVRLSARTDSSKPSEPTFAWSGSAIYARFEGTGATLRLGGSANQFAVVVDGAVGPILKAASGNNSYAVASGLSAGVHDLVIWKRTEGNQGQNSFLGLDITGGKLVAADPAPDRRIEIFGDSISAGYGLDGQGPNCPYSPDTENHYLTYGAVAARELKAELHTIAWSGIGMYRNYNEDGPSTNAMPQVYARTLAQISTSQWDFATWQPHAVIINLGTNDVSSKGDPGQPYETAYLDFVRTLREKYPNTHFILAAGPMLGGDGLTAIRTHLKAVIQKRASEGDTKMSYLEFPTQTQNEGLGCDWHPSAAVNARMAKQLVDELKTRLSW